MFGLLSLFYSFIFFINGLVILNDKRFLSRIKLPLAPECRLRISPERQKIVDIINGLRAVFEFPLLALNLFCILYEICLG
ncbi:immediate early response 3-interacting protein 1 [Pancytospora epiphaga]|nr:immediate early response 3-interacting protein 1 [Pancytospora epiphaga]